MAYSRPLVICLLMSTVLAPLAVSADQLGRLFTTREQRANLDDIRYQSKFASPPEPAPAPEVKNAEPVAQDPVVDSLRINGVVRSSRGGGTVWLNHQQVDRGSVTREGIKVSTGRNARDGVQIQLPSGVDTIILKPGQKIDVATGSVLEAYEADPQADAKSAFATEQAGADSAGEVKTAESRSQVSPQMGGDGVGGKTLSPGPLLKLLYDTGGKLPKTSGKAPPS